MGLFVFLIVRRILTSLLLSDIPTVSELMEIDTALRTYGLSKNETVIYLFLLKKLEATAFAIAKETGIPRTTVYANCELLKQSGLISQSKKNNVAYFEIENPKQLLNSLKEKEAIIQEVFPQINALIDREHVSPVAKLYTGADGMKLVLEDVLETCTQEKIKRLYATSQPELFDYLPKFFSAWVARREEAGIYTQLIIGEDVRSETIPLHSNVMRETRFLPSKYPIECSVDIYGNKLAFFSFKNSELYSVIVESPTIANLFRQFFLFTWEMLAANKS